MLEVIEAGQAGKSSLLFEMHRLRKRVFKDRLNWNVKIYSDDLEIDEFDIPEAVYLVSLNNDGKVVGSCRLLPTAGPNMICNIWPEFLNLIDIPRRHDVWESSRFSIDSTNPDTRLKAREATYATAELICGLVKLCLLCGVKEFYTLYDARIARLIRLAKCQPNKLSDQLTIDDFPAQVGSFIIEPSLLSLLQKNMGINEISLEYENLPPRLKQRIETFHPMSEGNAASQALVGVAFSVEPSNLLESGV